MFSRTSINPRQALEPSCMAGAESSRLPTMFPSPPPFPLACMFPRALRAPQEALEPSSVADAESSRLALGFISPCRSRTILQRALPQRSRRRSPRGRCRHSGQRARRAARPRAPSSAAAISCNAQTSTCRLPPSSCARRHPASLQRHHVSLRRRTARTRLLRQISRRSRTSWRRCVRSTWGAMRMHAPRNDSVPNWPASRSTGPERLTGSLEL